MVYTNGNVDVTCNDSCYFDDGLSRKTLACGEEVPQLGCLCPGVLLFLLYV